MHEIDCSIILLLYDITSIARSGAARTIPVDVGFRNARGLYAFHAAIECTVYAKQRARVVLALRCTGIVRQRNLR